ncbi:MULTISPECIES: PEP-CTERM sorting domain-containing protein [unclassified Microcystis]|jgi:hypothetical protein|uniref:PEP-CTERM sorting domain-containing protein n=1 Tax=unclassified Microcystis TaxID=2643300 RepID=UPI001191E030|nr:MULTISPECIES: PEP-CTERM sorting domain-containing protein [unclassified Microcystis]MCA2815857.1 PEP-CTERM sorting domain-containing protein [Microcystis sp. M085S1]MCA2855094.1 PEP-CTERM sorting domain-containing protein [Microcystis sp. M065S1]TRT92338.1 MAG: PEP-CTERM sorting domain-containing protein [Microcystis flos-aquae Ma_QC_C_20070823_S18D]TRV38943.1 MAG: PEP-CTERM sorting domain-containing protein [Microcystis flos-aquae Mf_QC_C_20070823_S20T]MCA2628404.1 PEP-CTERM sorting domain
MKIKQLGILSVGVALATLGTGAAQAASVTVNNFSFETPSNPNFSPVITGWTVSSGNAGVQPFNATQFTSGVPDGSQAALIAFNGGSIRQDVAATYQAGTRYTLNLFAGIRLDELGNLTLPNSTISLRRSDNNTVLSSFTFNQSSFSSRGVFLSFNTSYLAGIADQGAGIRISIDRPNNGGTQLVFDNVTLNATPVPEPSSLLGFITLGSLMLGSAVRKARK